MSIAAILICAMHIKLKFNKYNNSLYLLKIKLIKILLFFERINIDLKAQILYKIIDVNCIQNIV